MEGIRSTKKFPWKIQKNELQYQANKKKNIFHLPIKGPTRGSMTQHNNKGKRINNNK